MATRKLIKRDLDSEAWTRIRAYIADRTDELHTQIENVNLDETKTALIRGRLAELKVMLALETATAEVPRPGDDIRLAGEQRRSLDEH